MAKYDIIVIGGGPAGLAAAYYSAQQNKKVLLIDQATIPNQHGSSGGASRQWRLQYSQDHLAKLTLDTEPLWEQLQQHTQTSLIDHVGSLWFGDSNVETTEGEIERTKQVMSDNNIDYDPVSSKQLNSEYELINFPSTYSGFFQKDGGTINVVEVSNTLYRLCVDIGVTIEQNSPVIKINSAEEKCLVTVDDKTKDGIQYEAQKLIVCPGSYARPTLALLGIELMLPIEEWSSAYFKILPQPVMATTIEATVNDNASHELSAHNLSNKKSSHLFNTTWFAFQKATDDDPGLYYGFPEAEWERPGYIRIGAGFTFRRITEPKYLFNHQEPIAIGLIENFVKQHIPALSPHAVEASACPANPTPDENFILDFAPSFVPGNKNIIIFSGSWSFKFIPMIGTLCANLAINGNAGRDISYFNINRLLSKDCQHAALLRDGLSPKLKTAKKVVVVGAGIAGLTTAHLLQNAGYKVKVLEANSRVGGRIYTARGGFQDNQHAELGAMRIPSEHKRVQALIEKFQLQTAPFIYEDAHLNGLVCINGVKITRRRYKQMPALLSFRGLSVAEADATAEQLLDEVLQPLLLALVRDPEQGWKNIVAKFGHLSVMEYLRQYTTLSPAAIHKMGLLLNMEGTHMTSLIESIRDQTDLSPENSFYKIVGGMDNLPNGFLKDENFASLIRLNTKVTDIDRSGARIKLRTNYINDKFPTSKVYEADYVVMTITFPALSHITVSPSFSQLKRQVINNLHYDNSVKIFLQFNQRFWESEDQIEGGYTISDTPLRFTYYPSPDPSSNFGIVLASYTWGTEAQKWEGFTNKERIERAIKYLEEIHGLKLTDFFVWGVSHSWQNDPYTIGAFALFNPYQEADFTAAIRQSEGNIHFAGEHTSNRHAWIEGALESAVDVAQKIHHSDRPANHYGHNVGLFATHTSSSEAGQPIALLGTQAIDTTLPLAHHPFNLNQHNIRRTVDRNGLPQLSLFSHSESSAVSVRGFGIKDDNNLPVEPVEIFPGRPAPTS